MAYLYRLIALAGVLFLLSPTVQAAFPATQTNPTVCTVAPCYEYRVYWNVNFTSAWAPSVAGACDLTRSWLNSVSSGYTYTLTNGGANCQFYQNGSPDKSPDINSRSAAVGTPTYSCPANSTLSGSTCTCDATYTQNGSTCVPPAPVNLCAELAGKFAGNYGGPGSVGPKQICDTGYSSGDSAQPGCLITGSADFAAGSPSSWIAGMTLTGAKCLPNPNGSTDATAGSGAPSNSPTTGTGTQCKPGEVAGTVNGQTVCAATGSNDPKKTSSTTGTNETKPDGTTVGTQTTSSTDCTPTTCTTTTTTTTTTTPPGGSPTTQTGSTTGTCSRSTPGCGDTQSDEDRSSFSGTCGAAFACDGDAIMCSVALEQHKRNCALFVDATPESDLYNTEKGKTGTQYQNENVALGTGNFNQSNALGAGAQCIQDRNITVMGRLVVLPFSIVCSTLQHFGTILIFISFLLAYRIVARG